MRLREKLVLSYVLVAVAVLVVGSLFVKEQISYPGLIIRGILFSLLFGIGTSRLMVRPLQKLTTDIRQLAAVAPDENDWSQALAIPQLPDLESALENLREHTRQRVAQLAMEKSRLEDVLESITEGILVTGRDNRVVLANQALADLFGTRPPFQGRRPVEIVRNNEVEEAISRSLERCVAISLEVTLRGGPEYHLDVRVAPIKDKEECIGVVTVFYNITQLRQLERTRKDFVSNVSHELRTPLTAIKGYAETLTDGALDDRETTERFIRIISTHADRLTHLLDDILDLSRLEAENLEVEFESCSLRRLAETCIDSVSQLVAGKAISVALDIPADVQVTCDAKLIEQALLNLLGNAVKYTQDGGAVQIRTRLLRKGDQKRIVVEVVDTGIGIPSKDLERVFERFYRVDKGRSRNMGGTGLGLSIVRHIAKAHGERVWAESELGKGSTFAFTLRAT